MYNQHVQPTSDTTKFLILSIHQIQSIVSTPISPGLSITSRAGAVSNVTGYYIYKAKPAGGALLSLEQQSWAVGDAFLIPEIVVSAMARCARVESLSATSP